MPREASLFEAAGGSAVKGFFLLRKQGSNIPPKWIERASESRKKRQTELGRLLKSGNLDAIPLLEEWELLLSKEKFYFGLRILLELERTGNSSL